MSKIMDGDATPAQISAILVALRMKGETMNELTGFALEMRNRVSKVKTGIDNLVDTCGTGGDSIKTFNLSTAAAIVASAAGAPIAKHGNRAVTSTCGSADVLESLGVNLTLGPESSAKLLQEIGICFMFAPNFHPAMKHAAPVRKEIKLRTVFNLLGPLTNPAGASRQLFGVYEPKRVNQIAQVLNRMGTKKAVVAHGNIGIDEVSPIGSTYLAVVENRKIRSLTVQPKDFGVRSPKLAEISSKDDALANAEKLKTAISDPQSPECAAIIPGAAIAIWLADLSDDFRTGAKLAMEAVSSGKAASKLEDLISWSRKLA